MLTDPERASNLRRALDLFTDRMLADPQLAPWFRDVDGVRLRRHQREFLIAALTGGELRELRDLGPTHLPLGIDDETFDRCLDHVESAFRDTGTDAVAAAALRSRLEPLRHRVVAG